VKTRLFVLAASLFIHACILTALPGWNSTAFRQLPDAKKTIRVTLFAPETPATSQTTGGHLAGAEERIPTTTIPKPSGSTTTAEESAEVLPPRTEAGKVAATPVPAPKKPSRPKPERRHPASRIPAPRPVSDLPEVASVLQDAAGDARRGESAPKMGGAHASLPGEKIRDEILSVADVTVTRKVAPVYPLSSRSNEEQGTVVLIADIGEGRVVSVEIETSSGYKRLDAAAIHAIQRWAFASEGRIRVRIPVSFRLSAAD
jgi:protein TonB